MGSSSSKSFEIASGFSDELILHKYDGFLVDQWGVMHNGHESMKGAPECIAELAARGKKLVILSNSPASEEETLQALKPLGFDPDHFSCGAVTSGDLATAFIRSTYGGTKSNKALLMCWKNPAAPSSEDFLKRCGDMQLVDSVDDSPDVLIVQGNEILLGGSRDAEGKRKEATLGDFLLTGKTESHIDPILRKCVNLQIPLICVDPDFVTVNPDGSTFYMPGTIAKRYEELGGKVEYFGKPHKPGFQEGIRRLMNAGITDSRRMAMIGDSLHHDVVGSNSVDLDSILVLGGVHRTALGNALGDMVERTMLEELFALDGQSPTIVVPLLIW